MRSAFSIGPRIGRAQPEARLHHGVNGRRRRTRPASTRLNASRHSACCRRLPTNPATSRLTCTGVLPRAVSKLECPRRRPPDRCRGLHHLHQRDQEGRIPPMGADDPASPCAPARRSSATEMTDVFVASTASARRELVELRKSSCLSSSFSGAASKTQTGAGHRLRSVAVERDPSRGVRTSPSARRFSATGRATAIAARRRRIVDQHSAPRDGEYLRDAVAHQPGADDGGTTPVRVHRLVTRRCSRRRRTGSDR